jgi:hypothetical protein
MKRVLRGVLSPVWETSLGRRAQHELSAAIVSAQAVECFDRPRWLYRGGALPTTHMTFREPRAVEASDVALCARLIDAFRAAEADAPAPSGMWSHDIFSERHRKLREALDRADPRLLAELLSSMFRSDFVIGMALGSLGLAAQSRISRRFSTLYILSKLAALSECLGAARTESPEQGKVAIAFQDGIEQLVKDAETALGAPLDFPNVGAAYGVVVAGRLLTSDSPDQMYAAVRLLGAVRAHLPSAEMPFSVVEIGGGYGGMAYWLSLIATPKYTIIDLPIVNVLQGYFLGQALGPSEISCYGEEPSQISLLPTHALAAVEAPFTVLANKDSMPEIPEPIVLEYLDWAATRCTGLFYSYNQEAAAPFDDTPQTVVRDAVRAVGGLSLIRRDHSWLRKGYVEEIYLSASERGSRPDL